MLETITDEVVYDRNLDELEIKMSLHRGSKVFPGINRIDVSTSGPVAGEYTASHLRLRFRDNQRLTARETPNGTEVTINDL